MDIRRIDAYHSRFSNIVYDNFVAGGAIDVEQRLTS